MLISWEPGGDRCCGEDSGSSDHGSESGDIVEGPGGAAFCRAVAFVVVDLEEGRGGLKVGGLRLGTGLAEAGILYILPADGGKGN